MKKQQKSKNPLIEGIFTKYAVLNLQQALKRLEVLSLREKPSISTDDEAQQLSKVIASRDNKPVRIRRKRGAIDKAGWYKVIIKRETCSSKRFLHTDDLNKKKQKTTTSLPYYIMHPVLRSIVYNKRK